MIKLALRGLRFHWRSHAGLFLGATIATAILVGALAVGDSVRQSLRGMAIARLGSIHLALNGQSRFLRASLASVLSNDLHSPASAVMLLRGTASVQHEQGEMRSGKIQIVGADESFWPLASSESSATPRHNGAVVNQALARKLNLHVGDEVLLRIEKPSLLSRDAPLSTVTDTSVPLRVPVSAIVGDRQGGRFSLAANQLPPLTAFVPLGRLQHTVGMEGRANVILVGAAQRPPAPQVATEVLWRHWELDDADLSLKPVLGGKKVELRTDRVFLDPAVGDAALHSVPSAEGVLTYFVNELRVGGRSTPYSVVSALQGGPVPASMADDEILINHWLADDLGAKAGDTLRLTYWVVGPMRKLVTQSGQFRIRGVVPIAGPAADPDLMPNIPGLSDKKNCREWEPGVPIDLERIRDKDQDYWSKYRGTPKAFLTLKAGQKLWNNRFGNLTAVRYETDKSGGVGSVKTCIRQALNPASLGIYFAPIHEQAMAASATAMDFGQLFLAFSFFLIFAALLLTALLFGFAVEQRSEEIGALLAMGFRPSTVRRLLLMEAIFPMVLAAACGCVLGVLYTKAIVRGLNSVWGEAVAGANLVYAVEPATLAIGALMGFLTALLAAWLVMRKQARAPIRSLLASGAGADLPLSVSPRSTRRVLPGIPTAIVTLLMGLATLGATAGKDQHEAAEYFFMAGALFLISGLSACRALFAAVARGASRRTLTVSSLGSRGTVRRSGRSLAAVTLLACGSFLVIAVGASREDVTAGADKRGSGTGGFLLYGESTLPVYSDLNRPDGRDDYNLGAEEMSGVEVVQMRLRDGDEASCLNLNRAQVPRLLGVAPEAFRARKSFTFSKLANSALIDDPWRLLETPLADGAIPAVGDTNTIVWSLGKGLGDEIAYVDERGNARRLKIVGILENSVLQGSLLVNEADFVHMFPSVSGYQVFLVDAPGRAGEQVRRELSRGLEDQGLDLAPARERLLAFGAVEATYLAIFGALGGLGLLLGSAGLGVIVLRNVLERRGEFALLRAVGFRRQALHKLVFSEHSFLLLLGLGVGVIAAVAAVIPTVRSAGATPITPIALSLIAVLISGLLWTWLATLAALRGPLLNALRNE